MRRAGALAAVGISGTLALAGTAHATTRGNGEVACDFFVAGAPVAFVQTVDPADPSTLATLPGTPGPDDGPYEFAPSWSPDGRLALVAKPPYESGPGDIVVADPATGSRTNLTNSPSVDESAPAWSPDGATIAFTVPGEDGPTTWLMAADGSGARALGPGADPAWSPDGSSVVVAAGGALVVLPVDGGPGSRITDESGWSQPSWSPDGTTIVAARVDPASDLADATNLWSVPAGAQPGTGAVQLTRGDEDREPAWSPDGTTIAFTRPGQSTYGQLFLLDVASGAITPSADTCRDAAWAPAAGNSGPKAGIAAPTGTLTVGGRVTLTSTSTDAQGAIVKTAWDLDGDGHFGDASGTTVPWAFPKAGPVTIAVKVTDADGATAIARRTLTVAPSPKLISLGIPLVAHSGKALQVSLTCATACKGPLRIMTPGGKVVGYSWIRQGRGTTTAWVPLSDAIRERAKGEPVKLVAEARFALTSGWITSRQWFYLRTF